MFLKRISTGELISFADFIDKIKGDKLVESLLHKLCIDINDDIDTVLHELWFLEDAAWDVIIKEYGMEMY